MFVLTLVQYKLQGTCRPTATASTTITTKKIINIIIIYDETENRARKHR